MIIPRDPTQGMIRAGQNAVSGRPHPAAVKAIWEAMWDAAQGIEAGTATTEGRGPKDESPVP